MGLIDRLLRRVETPARVPVEGEDGFVHAPDAAPEEAFLPRRDEPGLLGSGPPPGWRQVIGRGTALGPWSTDVAGSSGGGGDPGSGGST